MRALFRVRLETRAPFVPAKAGTQTLGPNGLLRWVPACAGTNGESFRSARTQVTAGLTRGSIFFARLIGAMDRPVKPATTPEVRVTSAARYAT
jgi:hypothetical protein